jgi:Kef-type K+ transport system membrane component KefB
VSDGSERELPGRSGGGRFQTLGTRLFALAALLALAFVWRDVDPSPIPGAHVTLNLGFLLLTAYVGGQVAKRLGLSRVTGYILVGLVLGPSLMDFLSVPEVERLRPFGSVAIALIAITAGGELTPERIRGAGRHLAGITAVQSTVIAALVFGTVLLFRGSLPFTAGRELPVVLATALVFASVAVASSPSVAIAVITDTHARGPVSTAVLGVTVVKDVLVVILFAVALSLTYTLLEPGRGFEPAFALDLGREIGGSILLGAVVGAGIAAWLRWVGEHLVLFTVAVAWILVEVAGLLHLDLLLLALTAGFTFENIAPVEGGRFVAALEAASLPLYAIFFGLAGATVHLSELAPVWNWALLLIAVRALGIWVGTVAGAKLGRAPVAVTRHAWPAFISQAGVALGMVAIVANEFPTWGAELQSFFVGMVAIHELVGPIAAKWALDRAGEVGAAREAAAAKGLEGSAPARA